MFHRLIGLLLALLTLAPAAFAKVTIGQDAHVYTLENDTLRVAISKRRGEIVSVKIRSGSADLKSAPQELLGRFGRGYWSMAASSGYTRVSSFGSTKSSRITIDPSENNGSLAEVASVFHGKGDDQMFPGDVELRYALADGESTIYATAYLKHGKGDANFGMGEGRFVMKLDPQLFDYLAIDELRNQKLPSPEDWQNGAAMNLKEVRKMTTGEQMGKIEHKYAYSGMLGELGAYGWAGTKSQLGVWMINPSMEYIAGGPTKMELTGHLDVGSSATPTLLNMWHGSHYGGTVFRLQPDQEFSRVIGPFAIHFNQGKSPKELWQDAKKSAEKISAAWPFAWVRHPGYPTPAQRGAAAGRIVVNDRFDKNAKAEHIWVGLTAPDTVQTWRDREFRIDWQRDGMHYQYWARAKDDGTFHINGIRPGKYVLHAFGNGVAGEYTVADVEIKAGENNDLGVQTWQPERAGRTLWQIGIADRGAAEFRNGDKFWKWGNHLRYARDFPDDVVYTVGKDNWKRDWHICQPLKLARDGKTVLGPSTWTVKFDLDEVPANGALLRIGFCGSRKQSHFEVSLNGERLAKPESMPEDGVMHRDSYRGYWFQRTYDLPAKSLKPGENVLTFKVSGREWHQAILYDFIRLEEKDKTKDDRSTR